MNKGERNAPLPWQEWGRGLVSDYCTSTSWHLAVSWMERYGHECWWRGDRGIYLTRERANI